MSTQQFKGSIHTATFDFRWHTFSTYLEYYRIRHSDINAELAFKFAKRACDTWYHKFYRFMTRTR